MSGLYVCTECKQVFETSSALGGHMNVHKPVTPCPQCGVPFKTNGRLVAHMGRVHDFRRELSERDFTMTELLDLVAKSLPPGSSITVQSSSSR